MYLWCIHVLIKVRYKIRDAVGGYNDITDEFFVFGGFNDYGDQSIGYRYSYINGDWNDINLTQTIQRSSSQYYTQYNNVIYYYTYNTIKTYNMTYPYSDELSIAINGNTPIYDSPCLSVDINGNLFISSGGFVLDGNELNYYGYNINDNVWKTFSDSKYWNISDYDMKAMACIIHNQVLYTFGGNGGGFQMLQYHGSNMISYHDISDYNKPFLLDGYSLWNKTSQDLNPRGGFFKAVSVGELIYIIGGYSSDTEGFDDVQIFDPETHTIKGIEPVPFGRLFATTCHYRSTVHTINCFGGFIDGFIEDLWIYSNVLSESPTKTPSNSPTKSPTIASNSPSISPTELPSNSPTKSPSYSPSNTPSNVPSNIPSNSPTKLPTNSPTNSPTKSPTKLPTKSPTKSPSNLPSYGPSYTPTIEPSVTPTKIPSVLPSKTPTYPPTNFIVISENSKSKPLETATIIIFMLGSIVCILILLILYILAYYTFKRKQDQEKTASQIVMSVNSLTLPSSHDHDDNPVMLKVLPKPGSLESNNIPHFDPHDIESPKSINDIKATYINNYVSTHGNINKTVNSKNNPVVCEFENEYKNDGINHHKPNKSLQIEGSLTTQTIKV